MQNDFVSRRVIITGASGFIGGRLRDALLDDGFDVIALTRAGSPEPKRGRGCPVDYADRASLERVFEHERPEWVFHVAGATKGVTYDDFERANVMPTRHLLEAARARHPGLRRFVHISSLTAYGPSTPERPMQEEYERRPVEHYGRSKLEAERVVEGFDGQVPWTIIRPPAVYGPGDPDNFELFRLAARRLNVFFGNRDRFFSAVYVDDLVRGIRDAAQADSTLAKGYFLCDGRPLTWGEYQAQIVEACGHRAFDLHLPEFSIDLSAWFGEALTRLDGKPRLYNRQKAKLGHQLAWTCRHDAARRDFGYGPQVSVSEGVRRTLDWYRGAGWLR